MKRNMNMGKKVRSNDRHLARHDEHAQRVLLGLDDGTEEAALTETLDFGKFVDEIADDDAQRLARFKDARRERPMAEEQRRHREPDVGHRVSYRRR